MKQALLPFFLIMSFYLNMATGQQANFDEQVFFERVKNSYYTLSDTPIKNFTALVTSAKMEIFAKEMWDNEEIFPLQLIWFKPDKIYLAQKGVPKIEKNKYDEYQEIVNGIKMQIKGILLDLQKFYLTGLFNSIKEDYIVKHNEEAVQITFKVMDGDVQSKVKYLMGLNGLCILIDISYPSENKQIIIEPRFKIVKNKWLCTGWTMKTLIGNEISNGFNLTLKQSFVNNVWVPSDITLEVQKVDEKGKKFYDNLKLRNYLFDQDIELKVKN